VEIPNDVDAFTKEIWENLHEDNKISLFVRYIDLASGEAQTRVLNKNV
jgi:IMP cyclohydrolase